MDAAQAQKNLARVVLELPEAIQLKILKELRRLDAMATLHVISLCSKRWRRLAIGPIFGILEFDSMMPDSGPLAYAEHAASKHGRLCRNIKLSYSPGPLTDDLADTARSSIYAEVLKASSDNLHTLSIDTKGSNIYTIERALFALGEKTYPELKRLTLTFYSIRESGLSTLARFFEHLTSCAHGTTMPRLEAFRLDGHWTLTSNEGVVGHLTVLRLKLFLSTIPSLKRLCLWGLTISSGDLSALLAEIPRLDDLTLYLLEGLELQHYFDSLAQSRARTMLTNLSLFITSRGVPSHATSLLPARSGRKIIVFPSLQYLSLGFRDHFQPGQDSELGPWSFFTSFFECPWIHFPNVTELSLNNAFNHSRATSLTIGQVMCANIKRLFPSLQIVFGSIMLAGEHDNSIGENFAKLDILFTPGWVQRPGVEGKVLVG